MLSLWCRPENLNPLILLIAAVTPFASTENTIQGVNLQANDIEDNFKSRANDIENQLDGVYIKTSLENLDVNNQIDGVYLKTSLQNLDINSHKEKVDIKAIANDIENQLDGVYIKTSLENLDVNNQIDGVYLKTSLQNLDINSHKEKVDIKAIEKIFEHDGEDAMELLNQTGLLEEIEMGNYSTKDIEDKVQTLLKSNLNITDEEVERRMNDMIIVFNEQQDAAKETVDHFQKEAEKTFEGARDQMNATFSDAENSVNKILESVNKWLEDNLPLIILVLVTAVICLMCCCFSICCFCPLACCSCFSSMCSCLPCCKGKGGDNSEEGGVGCCDWLCCCFDLDCCWWCNKCSCCFTSRPLHPGRSGYAVAYSGRAKKPPKRMELWTVKWA